MHVYGKGKQWAQNADGSVHDKGKNSPGQPPRKVLEELKRKTGWDWNPKITPIQFDGGSRTPFLFFPLPLSVPTTITIPMTAPILIFP